MLKVATFAISMLLSVKSFVMAGDLQGVRFTAAGVVDSQYFVDGSPASHLTNQFLCDVSGNKYSMSFTVDNPNDARTTGIDCVYDGTNVFFTRRFSTNAVMSFVTMKDGQVFRHPLKKPVMANNNAMLTIRDGSIPPPDYPAVILVWLSLGSIADTNAAIAPVQIPLEYLGAVYELQHIKLKTASGIHDAIPGFLEWREDYHEGCIFSDNNGILERDPLQGELAGGYTNSTFRVLDWTSIEGLTFPKKMKLECYYLPSEQRSGVKRYLECTADLNSINVAGNDATNLASLESNFRPKVAPKTSVADTRQAIRGVKDTKYYLSEDGKLLTSTEAATNNHYKISSRQPIQVANSFFSRRLFLVALAISLAGLPACILAYKLRQEKAD